MRVHHIIAIAVALVAGVGVKQFFLPASTAPTNVDTVENSSVDPQPICHPSDSERST
jgi:hypothetical protein